MMNDIEKEPIYYDIKIVFKSGITHTYREIDVIVFEIIDSYRNYLQMSNKNESYMAYVVSESGRIYLIRMEQVEMIYADPVGSDVEAGDNIKDSIWR